MIDDLDAAVRLEIARAIPEACKMLTGGDISTSEALARDLGRTVALELTASFLLDRMVVHGPLVAEWRAFGRALRDDAVRQLADSNAIPQ